jgi:hypothetical protein
MKFAVQIVGYFAMLIGFFAFIGGLDTYYGVDNYVVFGGLLYFVAGLLPVVYIHQQDHK